MQTLLPVFDELTHYIFFRLYPLLSALVSQVLVEAPQSSLSLLDLELSGLLFVCLIPFILTMASMFPLLSLCHFLCSCFLYLHCSHLSSYYDQIHCHSIWPILATRPLFLCPWESSSLENHQRLISFLLLTVLITFAT